MACREIKFRGLDANGVLRSGRLSQDEPDSTVYYAEYSQRICWLKGKSHCNIPVSNKTLGQYTGLNDKNGVEIYEGDIIERNDGRQKIEDLTPVDRFYGCYPPPIGDDWMSWTEEYEVIGNIYENPTLLEEK